MLLINDLWLRTIAPCDITDEYVSWLNDSGVTSCLEIRHSRHTIESTIAYIKDRLRDEDNPHFGVFDSGGRRHVGTVTLNNRHLLYGTADISFVMGHPSAGKGYGTSAVYAVCFYAFHTLGLHKLTGGHYSSNVASQRVFQKLGFSIEGIRREQVVNMQGKREDVIIHGLLCTNFVKKKEMKIQIVP